MGLPVFLLMAGRQKQANISVVWLDPSVSLNCPAVRADCVFASGMWITDGCVVLALFYSAGSNLAGLSASC
jgi:hypothetical protein